MKILTRKKGEKKGYVMVHIKDSMLCRHISYLIREGLYDQAIVEAREADKELRSVPGPEACHEPVSLILTEKGAHWDMAREAA